MASILLVDSPVGSGFSYARDPKGYDVGDYSSSLQVQTFLNKVTTAIV
jgi:serine carboxypeptidase-like clade 1